MHTSAQAQGKSKRELVIDLVTREEDRGRERETRGKKFSSEFENFLPPSPLLMIFPDVAGGFMC